MTDPVPTMTALVPLTVTNRSGTTLLVKGGDGGDRIMAPSETADTHSRAAVLDMIDAVRAEAQAAVETRPAG